MGNGSAIRGSESHVWDEPSVIIYTEKWILFTYIALWRLILLKERVIQTNLIIFFPNTSLPRIQLDFIALSFPAQPYNKLLQ